METGVSSLAVIVSWVRYVTKKMGSVQDNVNLAGRHRSVIKVFVFAFALKGCY